MRRSLRLDFLRHGLGLLVFLAAPENELRCQRDSEERERKDLQRLNQKRHGDGVVAGDSELLRHQRVNELEESHIAGRRADDQADVYAQQTGEAPAEGHWDMRSCAGELERPQLTRPRSERQDDRGEEAGSRCESTRGLAKTEEVRAKLSHEGARLR